MANVDWNALRDRAYKCACNHGFHEEEEFDLSRVKYLMLILTEVSEAVEADRKNRVTDKNNLAGVTELKDDSYFPAVFEACIKDNIEDEIADIIIRCLDLAGVYNLDVLMNYKPRIYNYEYFMSQSFCESAFELCRIITNCADDLMDNFEYSIDDIISYVLNWCEALKIDIMRHIDLKIKYNETRPYKNGKNY
jgi:NTP pyrophosphatase (non-canonical NTP hydrolase)